MECLLTLPAPTGLSYRSKKGKGLTSALSPSPKINSLYLGSHQGASLLLEPVHLGFPLPNHLFYPEAGFLEWLKFLQPLSAFKGVRGGVGGSASRLACQLLKVCKTERRRKSQDPEQSLPQACSVSRRAGVWVLSPKSLGWSFQGCPGNALAWRKESDSWTGLSAEDSGITKEHKEVSLI